MVWALEISAVAASVSGSAGEKASADHPVGVQIAGKVGRDVWVESGAGAGVLAGLYFFCSSRIGFADGGG